MAYSFTEKKRIRKSFAKRRAVLQVPYLLATQIASYARFLQAEVAPRHARPTAFRRPSARSFRSFRTTTWPGSSS